MTLLRLNFRYTRASSSLDEWLQQGILNRDREPAFYCYEAEYRINGIWKKLRGFLGAVRIEELGTGHIHPHEMTYSKPKSDRLNILRFCNANISPIFSLYSSPERLSSEIIENTVMQTSCIEAKNGDGFTHRLWRISDATSIETIRNELSSKEILIADGHHRYETALEFKNELHRKGMGKSGAETFDYVMMLLVNTEDNGLTVLPTHRLADISGDKNVMTILSDYFDITAIDFDVNTEQQARQDMFKDMKRSGNSLGMYLKGQNAYHVLHFKGRYAEIESHQSLRTIDVSILHKLVFEKLLGIDTFSYEMDVDHVIKNVNNGSFQSAFFLNPTKIQDVQEVALAGQRMPPKSTYFYPKLLTGMVIYKF
jgi:uncharacterized protein (DUF1015 family)